ncbi:MAG: hypothetical protein QOF49_460, partial [Chloroflexota bacterium]|nr:hypothetical protein [Chloroflexota bacterium]
VAAWFARSQMLLPWSAGAVVLEGHVHSGESTISIETADWTYGMDPGGATWTDSQGTLHESGRPDCLVVGDHSSVVRFAAVQVTVDARTWRPIVWVDCRGNGTQ